MIQDGYIGNDGYPLKCVFCDSTDLNHERLYENNQYVVEIDVTCNNCKKGTGNWAYGYWRL